MKQDEAIQAALTVGVRLSPAQIEQLAAFAELLSGRGADQGLISKADAGRVWERHILDSLRAVPEIGDRTPILDLGSGAGLPGVPIAIALPQAHVGLVERRRSRAAFLELAVEQIEAVNAVVHPVGAEQLNEPAVPVCVSRALASPPESWGAALPHLEPGGRLIYFGGEGFDAGSLNHELMARCEVRENPLLESSGPLVIMTRK